MSDPQQSPSDDVDAAKDELEREPSGGVPLAWVAVGAVIATAGFFAYVVKDIKDRQTLPTAAPGASSAPLPPMVVPSPTPSTSTTASGKQP